MSRPVSASTPRQADLLLVNGQVLTMAADDGPVADGFVAVRGSRIVDVGPAWASAGWQADRVIDADGGLILPGLVNTHTHAAMTLFRGLADDLPLMTWLHEHIFPAEAKLDGAMVAVGTQLACAEMIRSGTTCFADMYLFEDHVAQTARRAGLRAVVGEVLYDFASPHYGSLENGFAFTEQLIAQWAGDPLISVAVEPHSPYLCEPALLLRAARMAADHRLPLIIHVAETGHEVAQMQQHYGFTPVGHLADIGVLGPNLVACHAVVLDGNDIGLLQRHAVKVSHNPESNMKLASGICPLAELLAAGVCVGLGTDGCASNNNLDLMAEMDTAAKLHKVSGDPTVADAATVLRMATIDAARVLGLDAEIGSLTAGKKADVIVVDTRAPHLTPMYDPVSHLVYAARGRDVRFVVVNGQLLLDDRRLTTIDMARLRADVTQMADLIRENGIAGGLS